MRSIVVDVDGVLISAVDSPDAVFVSVDQALVEAANRAASIGTEVPLVKGLPGRLFRAGYSTELELLAALYSFAPERSTLVEASEELQKELQKYDEHAPNRINVHLS